MLTCLDFSMKIICFSMKIIDFSKIIGFFMKIIDFFFRSEAPPNLSARAKKNS